MSVDLHNNTSFLLDQLSKELRGLKAEMEKDRAYYQKTIQLLKGQLIRLKNGDHLSDHLILEEWHYNDMSPEKAYNFFNQTDQDFILLDVSKDENKEDFQEAESIHVPIEFLEMRIENEIPNKAIPILVMSEDGTRSILACELLYQLGYFNINNVSGGHKFWPAHRMKKPLSKAS